MDKELEALQAEEALAITDPEAYTLSNPTPRDWTMSVQDIAKSIKINPIEALTTKAQREGPEKYNWLETVGAGIWDSIKTGIQDIDATANVANLTYSSPDMTQAEAERLMQDALYTRHFVRQMRQADTAEKIKYKKWYDFSNALGSVIKYAGLGIVTGSPAAIGGVAGLEAAAGMEADLVDRYIEKTGGIEGYTKEERAKDMGIAGAYGVFNGITETMLGVERIATGALGRYSTLEAMARLARMDGKISKSVALKALRRMGMSAIEEGTEEFVQSIGEDLANAIAGYGEELFTDASMKKALTSAMYGAIIGGPMGWGLYRYNRKSIVDKINRWNTERGAGLDEYKIAEIADQILEDGKTQMVDEIATRVEIRNQYGQAFDTVKERIAELVDATGTTPWTDQNKSKEEYIQAAAETVTLPAIIQANKAGLPLSEFLEVADMHVVDSVEGKAPVLLFQPITNVDDLQALLDKQNAIIKEQTDAAKLGTATEGEKENAQRRKAILQYQIRALKRQNAAENARRTRKKENTDYITAKDLQPEQTATIDTATQAEAGEDYVLFAGKRIPVEYQVVDLSEIQSSHINGEPNPNYTNVELQNRASRGTTQDVADLREKAANITPERLLRSSTSAEGAPVVNALGEVIAGNGRTEIIRYAYENPETAATYRNALEAAGFKTEGMERPILVRRNTTMTPEEQIAAADISNISETSAFDEASQAKRDTKYLKDSATPIDFAGKLPMSERRGLMQNNGKWNRRKVQQRYEDAMLSWLCGNDTQLFEALVLDRGIPQKVLDVLTANGHLIYETANKYPEIGLREDIYHALQKWPTTNKDNYLEVTQQVEMDGRDVMPENILLWNWIYADTTTNRQFLNNYVTKLSTNQEQVAAGEDMFGQTIAPLSKKDALIQAIKTTDEERAQLAAGKGREYESLFAEETGEIKNPELAAAVASYQNQFATEAQGQLFQLAYTSGTTYYDRPSTEYVLRGGEGQIVHGWGLYSLADPDINKRRYREKQFSGQLVFVPGMPATEQLIKGAKNSKENQIIKTVLNSIAAKTPINMYKPIKFAGGISSYIPLFYVDAMYELLGSKANQADKAFLDKIILEKGQLADETVFKTEPEMSDWLKAAIAETLDMHNDLKNREFYQKDLPYVFVNTLTLKNVETGLKEFVKNNFKHQDLSAAGNKTLTNAIVTYVQDGGRIEYAPFDNTIFRESGATTFKFEKTAQEIVEKMKDTLDGGFRETRVDNNVKTNPELYGGYLGMLILARYSAYRPINELFNKINDDETTFDNIAKDDDYKYMIGKEAEATNKLAKTANIMSAYDVFTPIVQSANKIYKSKAFNKVHGHETAANRTRIALSQAFRNLTQSQLDNLAAYTFTSYEIPQNSLETFISILQHPENIKKTRGQQLELNVPEDEYLLDEDAPLATQPSAAKLREIVTDFHWAFGRAFVENIREKSWREKNLKSDWKLFASKHGLKDETLGEFAERLENEFQDGPSLDTMTPERKLFIDYIMQTMHGEGLYQALADILPETYIELESGEEIGEVKDYEGKNLYVMGAYMPAELARDVALYLNDNGIKGITYRGGIDGRGFVIFSDESIEVLNRMDDEKPIYYQRKAKPNGFYDPELQAIVLAKTWNETTLVHEMHHRYLEKIWGIYHQAIGGTKTVTQEWLDDTRRLFEMLEIDPNQETLTTVQQERFASMVEAYITGLGVDDVNNLGFQTFLNWVPEKYKSIMNIGYLDENNQIKNPYLDERSIDFFNKWFASPIVPGLPSAPDAQRLINVTDDKGEIIPSTQKVMNNREKEWGQDSEIQNKADAQLWRAIGENTPTDMRAALDGEEVVMKEEAKNLPNDRILPTATKPTLRDKWFKTHQPDARERAAEAARAYVQKNPEHARELAFADPETLAEYDAPVDHGMLIRAVMETVAKGSDEWYVLDNNLAMVKSMSGSTLSLSGDLSHQAYLDAKREVEAARELKAAVNYAGTRQGAIDKWNADIRDFIATRMGAIIATTPDSAERKTAIKAFIEEAKTKFSGNTTNAILNQLDLTGYKTTDSRIFVKWAEKQIKQAAHAQIDTKEQAELMKASIAAQLALEGINSTEQKDGKYVRAVQSAKDIRHWQFVKDKMKKAYIGRWGRFGIFMDNLFGSYAPSAMLMSVNTLFFANVPSTWLNNKIVSQSAKLIGENKVNTAVTKGEKDRIKQIFNASGMNLAQMEKPTSPSMLHGEKYTNQEQAHWYNFTFDILGREDNWFRIPTFVDALARIATKNAKGDSAKATELFKEYSMLGNKSEEAQIARKQALAVANMAVFTQDGMMANALNHIRSQLNTLSRGMLGLDPNGFGLGNILAPFLKTGANVVEMGLTASLAPVRTIAMGLKKLQGKEIPEIKKIALKTDWTYFALTAVAVALLALLSGDDDDWFMEPYQVGKRYDPNKPYDSIRISGIWIKLDIFGPLSIPLRTAAKMVKDWEDKKMEAISNGLGFGLMEALGETPLVNQFTDSPIDYMSKYPDRWAQSFAYNQANKLVPAQVKSLTRAGSRATGATLDTTWAGKTLDRKFHRNYGLDGERLTTNDLLNVLTNRLKKYPQ